MSHDLKRILYVEDEADVRIVARMALEAIGGFEVVDYGTGAEAVAGAAAARADLIVLDVMMPGMDGPATLQELRALPQTARTPAIFMTAKVQPKEIERYRSLGVLGVVAKPFSPMEMPREIRRIWDEHAAA